MSRYNWQVGEVLLVDKPIGMTPGQVIKRVVSLRPSLAGEKMCFSGRLDPMASGLMLVLVGDECRRAQQYHRLDKAYNAKMIMGVVTDTFDVLGRVLAIEEVESLDLEDVKRVLTGFCGSWIQEYPPFAAVKRKGKPLWWWARGDRLHEVEIPKKRVRVEEAEVLGVDRVELKELAGEVEREIGLVEGDFRQEEISKRWRVLAKNNLGLKLYLVELRVVGGPGVYVRSLVNSVGEKLGWGATAWRIKRIKVGKYKLGSSQVLSLKVKRERLR